MGRLQEHEGLLLLNNSMENKTHSKLKRKSEECHQYQTGREKDYQHIRYSKQLQNSLH